MKSFLVALAFTATVAQAQTYTVMVNGEEMEVNPATGFLVKATPPQFAHIKPDTEFRESGDVYMPAGYGAGRTYASPSGARTYITSAGGYQVSRAGSMTFVTQVSRGRR